MNNKGKITVFLCLIISSMMILGLTMVKVVDRYSAREKVVMSARTAMSNVKSRYNSYIFENYHILLFDISCGGKGEGFLEEQVKEDVQANLGDNIKVKDVAITGYTGIMDNNCTPFKEQISEYMIYGVVEDIGENILSATDGEDGTLPEDLENNLSNAVAGEFEADISQGEAMSEEDFMTNGFTPESEDATYDPRDYTATLGDLGVLYIVAPEDMEISSEVIDISKVPSFNSHSFMQSTFEINTNFDSISGFQSEVDSHNGWADSLLDMGYGVSYANGCFNSATNTVNENTVFDLELEYIICGKESDYKNLKEVVNKIIAMRLPVNYAYLMSDVKKINEIKTVSVPLSVLSCIPEPIIRHLIAGAWAYVESVCEMRSLLEGNKLPFKKDSSTWITDLFDLENSVYEGCDSVEKGLSYGDYLTILLALEGDDIYLRMLDLIQLNTSKNSGEIYIKNCGVFISFDVEAAYEDENIFFNISTGY